MTAARSRRLGSIALALWVAGCGGDGKGKDARVADGPYAAKVNAAIPRVEAAMGLKFKTPPKVESRSKEEVRQFLQKKFDEESPAREMAEQERVYKRFGLLPDSMSMRNFMLELLTEQVVGYYDPAPKVLYIVKDAPNELVDVTVSHELVHALQDQYLNLDSIQKLKGANDRQMAAQAVIEGQATYDQLKSMLGNKGLASQLPGGWDRMRDEIRERQGQMPVFASAPMLVQETLIFPYLSGAEFMRSFDTKRPGKVPFDAMPASSEQIMHERAYLDRDEPTTVTLPEPNGGKARYQNDLGEFETRLFLFQHLQDVAAATRGATGWDGDHYVLFDAAGGDGLSWLTVWDSAIDAGEFFDLVDSAVLKRFPGARPKNATRTTHVYEAKGRTIAITAGQVDERPVVLYVDVPAGANINAIDLGKVRLGQ
jgi:hypothetical protein